MFYQWGSLAALAAQPYGKDFVLLLGEAYVPQYVNWRQDLWMLLSRVPTRNVHFWAINVKVHANNLWFI